MLLAIDVGNTNIVFGVFEGSNLLFHFRIESARGRTSDEYAVTVSQLLTLRGVAASKISGVIVASVVPSLTEPMQALAHDTFGIEALVVGPGIRTGVSVLYENPKEVGADRIVNAVAAYDRVRGGVIVVDFGTATTFDCITPRGEYLGGVIAPGLQISADALFSRAARLPRVEIAKPPRLVGRNTLHSMQSGIVYGYVGLVDGLVSRLLGELDYPCEVLATGGYAGLIAPLTNSIGTVLPDLTLDGLRLIYDRNVAEG